MPVIALINLYVARPGIILPIITASRAPVTLGILLGFPEIVSLARMAKASASFALGAIPNLFMESILTEGGK